ncbi:hypothetical protein [Qipengyuania sp.]|uniref:hypothetical protein n=1 Tax=Qipengyuania sp. TaxID=2004515 RepID=UPI0035C80C4C
MDSSASPFLRRRLLAAANAWCDATGKTLGSLSTKVTGTGKTLDQYAGGMTITDAKLEQFAGWFADPANWPEGVIAQEALSYASDIGGFPVSAVSVPSPHSSGVANG